MPTSSQITQAGKRGPVVLACGLLLALGGVLSSLAQGAGTRDNPFLTRQYACYNHGMSMAELADCGIGILSHFPWSLDMEAMRAFIEEAHKHDILLLPYVSPEKAWDDFDAVLKPRTVAGSVPYYRTVSPKDHRDWIIIREDGLPQLRYGKYEKGPDGKRAPKWDEPPGPGSWYMCANVEGYAKAVLEGCRKTMDMGFDGLFIDNAVTGRLMRFGRCHGPRHGQHQHRWPG